MSYLVKMFSRAEYSLGRRRVFFVIAFFSDVNNHFLAYPHKSPKETSLGLPSQPIPYMPEAKICML